MSANLYRISMYHLPRLNERDKEHLAALLEEAFIEEINEGKSCCIYAVLHTDFVNGDEDHIEAFYRALGYFEARFETPVEHFYLGEYSESSLDEEANEILADFGLVYQGREFIKL